jgi:Flp pilus assembly protein TadB
MIALTALWMPIVIAAVLVFFASALLHMVLPFHRQDHARLPDEDKIREAIGAANVAPGNYMYPHAKDMKESQTPEMMEKFKQGPVGVLMALPSGPPAMGKALGQWFVFCLLVSLFVAYIVSRTLDPGISYLAVFRISSTIAFMSYGMGEVTNSIWKGQTWGNTCRSLVDAFVYGLMTGGAFGWLWPEA